MKKNTVLTQFNEYVYEICPVYASFSSLVNWYIVCDMKYFKHLSRMTIKTY